MYRLVSDTIQVLVVEKDGEFRIPKGIREKCETLEEAACREVSEETGISPRIDKYLCRSRWKYDFAGSTYNKTVYWYLMRPANNRVSKHDNEYDSVSWLNISEAIQRTKYSSEKRVLRKAQKALS